MVNTVSFFYKTGSIQNFLDNPVEYSKSYTNIYSDEELLTQVGQLTRISSVIKSETPNGILVYVDAILSLSNENNLVYNFIWNSYNDSENPKIINSTGILKSIKSVQRIIKSEFIREIKLTY